MPVSRRTTKAQPRVVIDWTKFQGLSLQIQELLAGWLLSGGHRDGWRGQSGHSQLTVGIGFDIRLQVSLPDWASYQVIDKRVL